MAMDYLEGDNSLTQEVRRLQARLETLEKERLEEKSQYEELLRQFQSTLKIKSDFVAHLSHELRTPLNGMLPMVEMLLRLGKFCSISAAMPSNLQIRDRLS